MKHLTTGLASAALLVGTAAAPMAGTYYGLWWDGSNEHLVSLDPYTSTKTSIATLPGVNVVALANYAFDPDSSRYAFVGGLNGALEYIVLDAPTGAVVARKPKPDKLIEMEYSPRHRKVFGLQWVDSSYYPSPSPTDSGGTLPQAKVLKGTEYFVGFDPYTGEKDSTPVPGVTGVRVGSHVLDTDSGRYVFAGLDTAGVMSYYVLDIETGAVLSRIPHSVKIDNPVYDAARRAIHGLWWSDSTEPYTPPAPGDSGSPAPRPPRLIKGAQYFVTLNADSTLTRTEVPGVKYITFVRAFDTDSGRYVFRGGDSAHQAFYYVIDVETGAVISQTPATDNVNSLAYAPDASTIHPLPGPTALRARAPKTGAWSLTPARAGIAELKFENPEGATHAFSLLDLSGRTLLSVTGIRSNAVRFDVSKIQAGVYLFRLNAAGAGSPVAAGMLRVE